MNPLYTTTANDSCDYDEDAILEARHHASEALVDHELLMICPDYRATWIAEALAALQQVRAQRPEPANAVAEDEF